MRQGYCYTCFARGRGISVGSLRLELTTRRRVYHPHVACHSAPQCHEAISLQVLSVLEKICCSRANHSDALPEKQLRKAPLKPSDSEACDSEAHRGGRGKEGHKQMRAHANKCRLAPSHRCNIAVLAKGSPHCAAQALASTLLGCSNRSVIILSSQSQRNCCYPLFALPLFKVAQSDIVCQPHDRDRIACLRDEGIPPHL